MKRVLATFLILTFIFQIAVQFGIFLYFEANQNYIAKTQCENIKKPEMHCDGQCILTKLLKKTEQDKENKKAFSSRIIDALVHHDANFEFNNLAVNLKNEKAIFKPAFSINSSSSIFHPPPVV